MAAQEAVLWLWAVVLCLYSVLRTSAGAPSPSPHLRFVFAVGLAVDCIKTRTALLAYTRGTLPCLPAADIAMSAISLALFLASFTQQRRRHGLPAGAPTGTAAARPPPPEETASIAQLLLFSWMDPMIWLGYRRPLEPNDVYELMPEDRAERVCAKWRGEGRQYARAHGRASRSLTRRMLWFFRYRLALQCMWTLAHAVFIFAGPFFLRRILAYMEDQTLYTREQAFWFVAGLLAGGALASVCQSQALWIGRKIGIQIKSIIIGEVYAKSLRRRDAAAGDGGGLVQDSDGKIVVDGDGASSLGKITNLMAVDAHKVAEVASYLHLLYLLPIEIAIVVLMLYQLLGVASIGGLCTIIVLVPFQWWIVSIWDTYQDQLMKASDRRMNMMSEILQGVRIIKFFAWEQRFEQQVARVRGSELGVLRKRYLMSAYSILLYFMAPVFVTLTTFTVYTGVMGNRLTASVAFTALALFKTLRGPMDQLPDMISFCLQAKVSSRRVEAFLAEEETPKYALAESSRRAHRALVHSTRDVTYADVVAATVVGFVDASFTWRSATAGTLPAEPTTGTETEPLLAGLEAARRSSSGAGPGRITQTDTPVPGTGSTMAGCGFELRNLTVSFPIGKLSIVAGPTGSGKTSMLMALLGEMLLTGGQVMIPGAIFDARAVLGSDASQDAFALHESVAYVAQQAWLLNDTIRGNITFGLPFNEQRYNEVVHMCALTRDLEILPAGDMTEVGERGVALSGGQKQRICLARAVYSPARHIIMDDCLSAVDAHTAKHLYENCLMAPSMAERTRILVTHSVGLTIGGASAVVVVHDGQIAAAGSPAEVLQSGKLSEDTLRTANEEQQQSPHPVALEDELAAGKGKVPDQGGPLRNAAIGSLIDGTADAETRVGRAADSTAPRSAAECDGRLVSEEEWSRGHVQWSVYYQYIRASGGVALWTALAMLFLVGQGLQVAQDWWLREWAASYGTQADNRSGEATLALAPISMSARLASGIGGAGLPWLLSAAGSPASLRSNDSGVNLPYFIGVYTAIALACVVLILGRSLVQFWSSVRASSVLHERLLHTVLRAPVRFFDTTPVGRLINRFSKDMETIDQALSSSLAIFVTELIAALAILVVISVITPAFTLAAVGIAVVYWAVGVLYLSTSREIKRFESVTRSPIYSQFGETLSGASTIRAYGQEARFERANYAKIDDNIRPFIYVWAANRWLSIRVDLVGALVSFVAGLLALFATGSMDAGLAGLSLSYALNFTEHILWVVRYYSVNEMNLNSVERVVEYLDVAPEAPMTIPDRVPPPEWPTEGRICVENLVLRYADSLPPVIRGISFNVHPREKVGIVGRTGAGKSTLTLAMLRIMEASAGRIVVDGEDIAQMGVGDLRSRVTIIPQDPMLFTGTVRSNLDPFDAHGDDELWLALRRAHLLGDEDGGTGDGRPMGAGRAIAGLDMVVAENGSNFSQGQRQLIALARALVKRTRVLILDEATASVDFDTDAKIQMTIRSEFTGSTLLCIAHRLRTIVDYDRVLVLDHGEIVEFDTPYNLLGRSAGLFRHMCGVDMGHVRGGWAGHVCLPVGGRCKQELQAVARTCARIAGEQAGAGGVEVLEDPHISLTRTFYVQEHQIAGFVRALEASMAGLGGFAVAFGAASMYRSERGSGRAFVAVDVDHGAEAVKRVVEQVDRVMDRFGRRRFFARPRFHASIVRADLDRLAERRVGGMLGACVGEEILQLSAAQIDTVQCVFGSRQFCIALDGLGQQQRCP
ncbi:Transporter of the ATP-binding cassette (ABC) [Coemansia biformis]|uniref:Transporter of the ATP-binding cassette (ABC) n=1 Tax=Coemansia biformis TaxID=1286918 RepID=A0A9W7YHG2_9FUNG|nr:Transporter of the ATP-binding cassette (ABC) [Coemansia biformis]